MFNRIKDWIISAIWEDEGDVVTQCPVCMKWIENGEGMQNWIRHLLDKHKYANYRALRRLGFDIELQKYLVGDNPEYGRKRDDRDKGNDNEVRAHTDDAE